MALETGSRLGPYEIEGVAGAGGMGEVYRARDTRLDRTVAIKVLPTGSSGNADLRQRFEREAKAVSSLNHPNICVLYDVGHEDGTDYLVMEYLEGESLAARLEKGPLPAAEFFRIAVQIADALDRAHRQGLVHRDLKPGNIMLTKSGAKLLDFGLARFTSSGDVVQGVTGVTRTTPLTGEGTILGTLHYMPPEQLEGKEADSRSDIFAFGCVLYEMATGKRAFDGKSQASLIAAIMGKEPAPVSTVSAVAPPALDRIVSRCLAKDPDDRWQTARDLMHELQWLTSGSSQITQSVPVTAARKSRSSWGWWAAGLILVGALALQLVQGLSPKPVLPVLKSSVLPPEEAKFSVQLGGSFALSPDGGIIAYTANDTADGNTRLWVRPMESMVSLPLPGTDGAYYPFWSADSRYVAFFAGRELKKILATGGPVVTICQAPQGRGGTWNADNVILFCPDFMDVLYRVAAAGGTPVAVTVRDSSVHDFTHRWPSFLPDGNHFLYFARTGGDGGGDADALCVGSLDGKVYKRLFKAKTQVFFADGRIVFANENNLMAQPFDPNSLNLLGDAVPIAEDVSYDAALSRSYFSVSQNGRLLYQTGAIEAGSTLLVMNREGKPVDSIGLADRFESPRWSPDGKQLAVDIVDASTNSMDIWLYDTERGIRTRFTFDPDDDYSPVWSPDGSQIAFVGDRGGQSQIFIKNISGMEEPRPTAAKISSGRMFLDQWSPDGQYLAYVQEGMTGAVDIWILPTSGETEPYPFIHSSFLETEPAVSPDGRWIAYMSDESGKEEVYVASFPKLSAKYQVSIDEGDRPVWRKDGRELYYTDNNDHLMVAQVDGSGEAFRVGRVEPLFEVRPKRPGKIYDASADGQRFVVNTRPKADLMSTLTLVVNWPEELRQR